MNSKIISEILLKLRPNAEWVLQGDTLSGLQWLDKVQTRPTDEEITKEIDAYVPPLTQEERIQKLEDLVKQLTRGN